MKQSFNFLTDVFKLFNLVNEYFMLMITFSKDFFYSEPISRIILRMYYLKIFGPILTSPIMMFVLCYDFLRWSFENHAFINVLHRFLLYSVLLFDGISKTRWWYDFFKWWSLTVFSHKLRNRLFVRVAYDISFKNVTFPNLISFSFNAFTLTDPS